MRTDACVGLVVASLWVAGTAVAADATAVDPVYGELPLRLSFAEQKEPDSKWEFGFHGYARMGHKTADSLFGDRPPYLVDDRYFKSGFAYLPINEGNWTEMQLSAKRDGTRIVVGLFASEFSDWSAVTIEDQKGMATGFIEHRWQPGRGADRIVELKVKAGVFWERMGYQPAYDTYLFGRTHVAGLALDARIFDGLAYGQVGRGAHAREDSRGFTSLSWGRLGSDLGWLDVGLYGLFARMDDDDYPSYERWNDNPGSLDIMGADVKLYVPGFGKVGAGISLIDAEAVGVLHGAVELLHATDGDQLKINYFGEQKDGTGELRAIAFDALWQTHRTIDALVDRSVARYFEGLDVRLFGMSIYVIGETDNADPKEDHDERGYLKWGTELSYRPKALNFKPEPFVALRFDRVILNDAEEDLSFRVLTTRLGITPTDGFDIFVSYSRYRYGDAMSEFLEQQDKTYVSQELQPDEDVYKLQAQASW